MLAVYKNADYENNRVVPLHGSIQGPKLGCDIIKARSEQYKTASSLNTNAFYIVERIENDGKQANSYHAVILLDRDSYKIGEITGEPADYIVEYTSKNGAMSLGTIWPWYPFYTYYLNKIK